MWITTDCPVPPAYPIFKGAFNGILQKWPLVRDHASAFASAEPASIKGLPALAIK